MSSRLRDFAVCLVILSICAVFGIQIVSAGDEVYAGRNINMVSGLYYSVTEGQPVAIGGDPYLQRQNEPSIAVSTRNPMHLLAGANDYRTVDIPFSDSEMVGDSWLGLFKSFDGGQTWQSTLLPDYPQSINADSIGCPKNHDNTDMDSILGCQAAADPTVRAGTNGMFYYSGIAFDRDKKHLSRLFVSRFIDLNNREGAFFDVPANKDPIKYIDTHVVNIGTPGQFTDKPWLAVDIPRPNAETVDLYIEDYNEVFDPTTGTLTEDPVIVPQQFACGNVYLAYSVFLGNFGNTKLNKPVTEKMANITRTRIEVLRSTDCGETWEKNKGNISAGFHINQGVTLAVDPKSGDVYVAWQVFDFNNQEPQVVVARSFDGGEHFAQRVTVAKTKPFNQGTRPGNSDDPFRLFRTNAYPTMAIDDDGRVYVAWSERDQWGGDNLPNNITPNDGVLDGSRIMISYSEDHGQTWLDNPYPADVYDLTVACDPASDDICHAGHNIMPSISYSGGKLTLLFYDFRYDYYPKLYDKIKKNAEEKNSCDTLSHDPGPDGESPHEKCMKWISEGPIDRSLPPADAIAFEPFPVRHTIDARIAVADITALVSSNQGTWPFYDKQSIPVSKYASTIMPDLSVTGSPKPLKLYPLQSNQVNLPLFLKGTSPFIGDYIDITASQSFVPGPDPNDPTKIKWDYNNNTTETHIFHAAWTDNRDVMPPPAKIFENDAGELVMERPDWTEYEPPAGVVLSGDYWPGMRNQNIYTSRITEGLVLGTYGNSKPLNIERAFSVFVENTHPEFDANFIPDSKRFKLTLTSNNAIACFEPLSGSGTPTCSKTEKEVDVTSLSKVAVTVFAQKKSGNDLLVPIEVTAQEMEFDNSIGAYAIKSNGLKSSMVLNPDPTNPDPLNADAENKSLYDLETRKPEFVPFSCSEIEGLPGQVLSNCGDDIESVSSLLIQWPVLFDVSDPGFPDPTLLNPALLNTTDNPALLNPALLNPALLNPALLNPALLNPALLNDSLAPALLNPALLNPALLNPALLNPALLNDPLAPALLNPALLNPALLNPALLNPALLNPALLNPALLNPALLNPALLNPALLNPALLNPSPGDGNSLSLGEIAKNTWLIQGEDLDPIESTSDPVTLTDLTWRVKNVGNSGSSYLLSWNSSPGLQLNPSQILVYRTYRTPSIDPGSYLLNEAGLHHEFLLNVLEAGMLTPGPHDPPLSFSMAPSSLPGGEDEDYIYITLRFMDPDGQEGSKEVKAEDVAITVQPEASTEGTSTLEESPTYTSLFSSQGDPNDHGKEITFTAYVNPVYVNSNSGNLTLGTVDFFDGFDPNPLKSVPLNSSQKAVLKTSSLPAGSRSITAVYNGVDGKFRKSTSGPVIQHVKKLKQSIKFKILTDGTLLASASSGLPVSFSTQSKNCSIDGDKIKFSDPGMCVVKASQAGSEKYRPAPPVVRHLKANKTP